MAVITGNSKRESSFLRDEIKKLKKRDIAVSADLMKGRFTFKVNGGNYKVAKNNLSKNITFVPCVIIRDENNSVEVMDNYKEYFK